MSGIRSITRRPTIVGTATAGSAPFYVDSDDNRVKLIPAGTGTTEVILQEASGASAYERLVTTRVLTAADSGKTFALALAGGFTVTLPLLSTVAGFNCKFVVEIAPTTDYVIICNTTDLDKMAGQVYGSDGADGDSETDFTADQLNFVASASVIGDSAEVLQVGTAGWQVKAWTNLAATGATFTG
jgi:hypothetical protein